MSFLGHLVSGKKHTGSTSPKKISEGSGMFLIGDLVITIHEAKNLPKMDTGGLTDGYVRVIVNEKKGPKTATVFKNLNPVWNEDLVFNVAGCVSSIKLVVKDEDFGGISEHIGDVDLDIQRILSGQVVNSWFPILGKGSSQLRISAVFKDSRQFKAVMEVPDVAFPERQNCRATLYQDAHIHSQSTIPNIQLNSTKSFNKHSAWEELYQAICDAQHFIYITGWSVWTEVKLLRERPLGPEGLLTLGEILKQKANSGVKVLMLVWDEVMSKDNAVLNTLVSTTKTGLMNTHDEETRAYFANTKVCCKLVKRQGGALSNAAGNVPGMSKFLAMVGAGALFTHHQKSVICDSSSGNPQRRRIIAFLGGLDLTSGRWDIPSHPIFSTLMTHHREDFYQGYADFNPNHGPRQPWHDIHCRVEGPIARDVMKNFEQRWKKQVSKHDHELVDLSKLPILQDHEDVVISKSDGYSASESWNMQLFRSIDHNSAEGVEGVDQSIYKAYLHHIRRADHFIYIENQYFLGGSQQWEDFDEKKWNVECKHRIPIELAAKIVSKIIQNKRFAAYIVIPMHPEGPGPEKGSVQAILYWQYKTIQMIYDQIRVALFQMHSPLTPFDYLNFYFLGAREPGPPQVASGVTNERQLRMGSSRRAMIYVHSKMMIVDDEYIIIGSANINERSMSGDRDTEIAVGMHQPQFIKKEGQTPRGHIRGFRLALWGEHMGVYEPVFDNPSSVECVQRVNQMAEHNWMLYDSTVQQPMAGHLCKYPYLLNEKGVLQAVRECFPDMEPGGKILGAPQNTIPNVLTT